MAVDLVDSLQAALTYHRDRHAVLAGNVANLDTPGYRPLDLTRRAADDPREMEEMVDMITASRAYQAGITSTMPRARAYAAGATWDGSDWIT